jgi:hypothetical protein
MLQSFTGDGNIQTSPAYRFTCSLTASRAVLDSLTVRPSRARPGSGYMAVVDCLRYALLISVLLILVLVM